jgi:hypothetical protein
LQEYFASIGADERSEIRRRKPTAGPRDANRA